jgi:hypothetical protein
VIKSKLLELVTNAKSTVWFFSRFNNPEVLSGSPYAELNAFVGKLFIMVVPPIRQDTETGFGDEIPPGKTCT